MKNVILFLLLLLNVRMEAFYTKALPFAYYPLLFTGIGCLCKGAGSLIGYGLGYRNAQKFKSSAEEDAIQCLSEVQTNVITSIVGGGVSALGVYGAYIGKDSWGGLNNFHTAYLINNWYSKGIILSAATVSAFCSWQMACTNRERKKRKIYDWDVDGKEAAQMYLGSAALIILALVGAHTIGKRYA